MSPMRPSPPCRWPGCPETQAPGGQGYCATHAREHRKQDAVKRGSARQRGYTRRYEKAREWVLKRQPLCVICKAEGRRLTVATVTHHIQPLAKGGTNRANNLLPLCKDCHDRVHAKGGREILAKAGIEPGRFF
ncbi:MAG: HNH endonuclease [Peptococcaceae bacterium]|nr:HNH endonuclease [Peptococcaceae bacterium]